MNLRSQEYVKAIEKLSLHKVTLTLSPKDDASNSIYKLPKRIPTKLRATNRLLKALNNCNKTYSIAYIGDNSGLFTISSSRRDIPKISKWNISRESKLRTHSHTFLNNISQYTVYSYPRPKPLSPASFKMQDFSQFKVRANSIPRVFKYMRTAKDD